MEDDSTGEEQERNQEYDLDEENGRDEVTVSISIPHQSQPISVSSLPSRSAVTLATQAPVSRKSVTLALPIQAPRATGGGREDCWSEGATDVLIDAWGERYLHLSRGNLKHNHWREVADAVTSRENYRKAPKTDVQCKNRIDTLKKKYKMEKSKIASAAGSSGWIFFDKLDRLVGPTATSKTKTPALPTSQPPVAKLIFSVPTKARSLRQIKTNSEESRDSFPPEMVNGKKRKLEKEGDQDVGDPLRELSRAIERFGEVYEKVEKAKLKQLVDMERQRLGFLREIESQRTQFYTKIQMEISSLNN
ncbi:trihelix transcription factor ASIL2-like [Aristolochia californica]|uniref:trihelix transcription factor ASIL2-like n=1 Tax=Aristolochia californica TaxID=171875 RepID=UPI0035E2A62A